MLHIIVKTILLGTVFITYSCASFGPSVDVKQKIKEYKLAGKWRYNNSTMTIYCNGSFALDDAATAYNISGSGKENGGFIKSISKTKFITGPLFSRKYKITKLPFQIERPKSAVYDRWHFEADNRTWTADEVFICN